jgi:hypothetical protein
VHVNVRIQRRWSFEQVRRAALALAREVERRAPNLASSKWWKEERRGVFLDYNQNDRLTSSILSHEPGGIMQYLPRNPRGRHQRLPDVRENSSSSTSTAACWALRPGR